VKAYVAVAVLVAGGVLAGRLWRASMNMAGSGADSRVEHYVTSRVQQASLSNRQAAAKGEVKMRAVFEQMRAQVPAFVEDINGLGTKCKTLCKGAADLWPYQQDRTRVQRMVEEKWKKHMITPEDVERRLTTILQEFMVELNAERNRMLVDVGSALRQVKADEVCLDDRVRCAFDKEFETKLKGLLATSLKAEIASLVISEAAAVAIVNVVSQVLVKVGILAAGGLSAPMTFGIGLVVGLIVDWIISNYAEAMMRENLVAELNKLERMVMDGEGIDALGMAAVLHKTAEAVSMAEQEAVRKTFAVRY